MAIPWLTVLSNVPWTEVIRNAPKVADGARRLWQGIGGTRPEAVPDQAVPAAQGEAAALQGRIADLEARVAELHGQMLASSELIKQLAEQNTQLVARLELARVRLARLAVAAAVTAVLALAALILAA